LWLPSYYATGQAIQGRLGIGERTGKVVSLDSLDGVELPPEKEEGIRKVMGEFERLGYTEERALEVVKEFEQMGPSDGIDEVKLTHRGRNGNVGIEVTMTSDELKAQADALEETLE